MKNDDNYIGCRNCKFKENNIKILDDEYETYDIALKLKKRTQIVVMIQSDSFPYYKFKLATKLSGKNCYKCCNVYSVYYNKNTDKTTKCKFWTSYENMNINQSKTGILQNYKCDGQIKLI